MPRATTSLCGRGRRADRAAKRRVPTASTEAAGHTQDGDFRMKRDTRPDRGDDCARPPVERDDALRQLGAYDGLNHTRILRRGGPMSIESEPKISRRRLPGF
jgi:hypothetical protein